MKDHKRVLEIIIDKVKADYSQDIALLFDDHNPEESFEAVQGLSYYFIPKTERANRLSIQFIIDGISYDLFPMQWDRMIANAAMDSPQWYLLLGTRVVYCGDQAALGRFEKMKESLKNLLHGDNEAIRLNKAYEYFNESYIYLYNMRHYQGDMASVRLEVGKLLDKIATALAFINCQYYKGGTGTIMEESLKMTLLPEGYGAMVDALVFGTDVTDVLREAEKLVTSTRRLLLAIKKDQAQPEPYETIFTGYYEEIKRYIDQCRKALKEKRYFIIYEYGTYLEEEISQFNAKVNEGVWYDNRNAYQEYGHYYIVREPLTLLEAVSMKDDVRIMKCLDDMEEGLLTIIRNNGLKLLDFDSVDAFEKHLKANR